MSPAGYYYPVYLILAAISKNFLIVHRPSWYVKQALMCTQFSDSGNVTSNCTLPAEWIPMELKYINESRIYVFSGDLLKHRIGGAVGGGVGVYNKALLFYKIRYIHSNTTIFESDWNSLIRKLDNYKSAYNHSTSECMDGSTIFLILLFLLQASFVCAYFGYRQLKKLGCIL